MHSLCLSIRPSGAGKTTLVNVLTMEHIGGTAEGDVRLDGTVLDREVRACLRDVMLLPLR